MEYLERYAYILSSIGQTGMFIRHSNIHLSNEQMDNVLLQTLWSFIHMGSYAVMLLHFSFLGIVKVTCPLDIEMSIRPLDKRNVHWTFEIPFVQWTNGHCLMANRSVSYTQGVMPVRIMSFQQFWHCKTKKIVHSYIGQTEMSIEQTEMYSG